MTEAEVPAAERGATRIADRVVAKVAAEAAREALRAGPEAHTLPPGGRSARSAPGATVAVRELTARVRVSVELGYPSDIGAQCGAVRRHVAARVRELVGMEVPDVGVDVERLHTGHLNGSSGRVR
ncbi:Asp23/Gls24 family envelope stress response protein [Streptomyces sp. HNM0574]|uniref:Asp23/Gls24 family envelope stress response protein n=1 Tax=Streptomyces sp. HNM0574 TaxID=2714954 RepID=UPI00146B0C8A|nr:Asp23/Gls24 family envelope stress response protein [Streptomyces sp. HNM0574]